MKKIYLGGKYGSTIGNYAFVDDDVYEEVNKYRWRAQKRGRIIYAWHKTSRKLGKRKTLSMHRFIWELKRGFIPDNMQIDHILNMNEKSGLNNQLENLRLATSQQNNFNKRPFTKGSSKYKGVYLSNGKWRAQIQINRKTFNLGSYLSEMKAAIIYDIAAVKYFGDNAWLNFPQLLDKYKRGYLIG